jgi:lipopolysaccharide export system protein LptC
MAPVPARERYDWSARARTTILDAKRYTRFVGRMKKLLSFSAFAIIFAVLAFFFLARVPREFGLSYERIGTMDNDRAMINPRLTGADAKGNPFVITAKEAVQDAKNSKRATLKSIEADMTTEQGWVNAKAGSGVVDMATKNLELGGGLDIFTDSGYMLHTDSASADLKTNIIRGSRPVSGQGPRGTLRADAFHYDRNAGRLTLQGNVRTTILPERK